LKYWLLFILYAFIIDIYTRFCLCFVQPDPIVYKIL
jgi:hypothetical protein